MMQPLPGDTFAARLALVRAAGAHGWTRVAGAPRNVAVLRTLRELSSRGAAFEYNAGAIVVKGTGSSARRGAFVRVPGDARLAGAWIAAALLQRRTVMLERVHSSRAFLAAIGILQGAGAQIELRSGRSGIDVAVRPSHLAGFSVAGAALAQAPALLAVVATSAHGESRFPKTTATHEAIALLRALGIVVRDDGNAFAIAGPQTPSGGTVRCGGDLDRELAAAVASLATDRDVLLDDERSLLDAYPNVLAELRAWSEVAA